MSLRLRLTLWYSGLLAGALLIFGVSVYMVVSWTMFNEVKETVKSQNESIIVTGTFFSNTLDLNVDRQSSIEGKNMYVQLVNYQENKVRQSANLKDQNFHIPYAGPEQSPQEGFETVVVDISGKKYNMLTYQRPLYINSQLVGLLQVGAVIYYEEQIIGGIRNIIFLLSILVVAIAFIVGNLIARQALRPIEKVITATRQIENGQDLSVRIPEPVVNDEVGTLVNTLNLMLSRLEKAYNELNEAYKAQRRFVSDASHELRTPLTTIRGNIDLLNKMWNQAKENMNTKSQAANEKVEFDPIHFELSYEAMSDISAEAKRMSTLVNDLLALARADAGYVMEKGEVDIYALTEGVVRRAQLLPRKVDWNVQSFDVLKNKIVYGNEDYLQQLLFIFIENAFRYTDEGSVSFRAEVNGSYLIWSISDTGIGMSPDKVPHIFERFYRADESRGLQAGTGLGLAIAKWIVEEHGGSVEVETLEGKGTTFRIWLPLLETSHLPPVSL